MGKADMEKMTGDVGLTASVRPHNEAELRQDSVSAWATTPYDTQLIKLAKGRDGGRDDREWHFGEFVGAA